VKLLFVNLSAVSFTAATPDHAPLGGSESALCYLARALAAREHDVALIANLPSGQGGVVQGVRHFPVATLKDLAFFAAEKFDTIILCNAPAAAAPLKAAMPQSRILFWAHALPDQPSMKILAQAECKQALDATIFVSEFQCIELARAFGSFKEAAVIGNGIAPVFENMFAWPEELLVAKQNRAAYTATPYRGLSVLLRAMQDFTTPLDLFSSMQLYQAADDTYADLFKQASQNPAITQHGAVPQDVLAQHLRSSAFLFYPCIYPETFCISAAEAMAAGMKVVTTKLGALAETTMGFADLVPVVSGDGDALARDFRAAMQNAVDEFAHDPAGWAEQMYLQSRRANVLYSWDSRAEEWEVFLAGLA
jgi:glycosyltransferase involved in cell wall biosynthesis